MRTFLEYYESEIQPQIEAMDIYLKTEDPPYTVEAVSELLHISAIEGKKILAEEKLACITKGVFFCMLEKGSAPLCGMFRRALACGLPEAYTAEQIAYIFGLDIENVRKAVQETAKKTGTDIFTESMLPLIFEKINL